MRGGRIGTAHPCHYHVANDVDDGIDRATIVVGTAVAQCKVSRYLVDLCFVATKIGIPVIQLGRRTATVKAHQPAFTKLSTKDSLEGARTPCTRKYIYPLSQQISVC